MTGEKIIELGVFYHTQLYEMGITGSRQANRHKKPLPKEEGLSHARWMSLRMIELVDQGRIEKAFRWLGHIQGLLVAYGVYSINEVKEHSRPTEE